MTNQIRSKIESLREEAKDSEILNNVLHAFAIRKRARSVLTLHGLALRMKAEGYNYTPNDFIPVLKTLAKYEFGNLKVNARGKVVALVDIKVTLQSIGAALFSGADLKSYEPRNKFVKLTDMVRKNRKTLKPRRKSLAMALTVTINGKPVSMHIPSTYTTSEIAMLISRFTGNDESAGQYEEHDKAG